MVISAVTSAANVSIQPSPGGWYNWAASKLCWAGWWWLGLVAGLGRAGTGFWIENRDIRLLPSQLQQLSAIIYSLNMGRCWSWCWAGLLSPHWVLLRSWITVTRDLAGGCWQLYKVITAHH